MTISNTTSKHLDGFKKTPASNVVPVNHPKSFSGNNHQSTGLEQNPTGMRVSISEEGILNDYHEFKTEQKPQSDNQSRVSSQFQTPVPPAPISFGISISSQPLDETFSRPTFRSAENMSKLQHKLKSLKAPEHTRSTPPQSPINNQSADQPQPQIGQSSQSRISKPASQFDSYYGVIGEDLISPQNSSGESVNLPRSNNEYHHMGAAYNHNHGADYTQPSQSFGNKHKTKFSSSKTNHAEKWNPRLTSQKKRKQHGFSWVDYSLSFVLLVISVALGFNLAFQHAQRTAQAQSPSEVAGAFEQAPQAQDTSNEPSITQEQFEAWMKEHYPEEAKLETNPSAATAPIASDQNVFELFGVTDLQQINDLYIDESDIGNQISTAQKKTYYINLSKKIDSYMASYRSFEAYDNQMDVPLSGMTYIAVSEKTGMPLKYLMAISRAESRFGTDKFTSSGGMTRPGKYLNPCSIGLDDSGGNIGFASWEAGLEACGKWYQYFESKGVSDCRKWRIFNPNGDYCSKIETLAAEIDAYLAKES